MTTWQRAIAAPIVVVAITTGALAQEPGKPAQSVAAAPAAKAAALVGPGEEYRIGPEDALAVSVWNNEALSRTVLVRPDGMISLPLLQDVKAAGLTPKQLRDILVERLAEYMPTPEVTVIVNDIRHFKVSVMGEVTRPARYQLKSWTTVLDVLAEAGGFTQYANRGRITILRPNDKTMTRIPFNYNRVIQAGGEHENIYLQPGDIVLVP